MKEMVVLDKNGVVITEYGLFLRFMLQFPGFQGQGGLFLKA